MDIVPEIPDAIADKLAQLGIAEGAPMQVFTADSAQGQAALAAFSHLGAPVVQTPRPGWRTPGDARARPAHPEEYAEQRHRILDEI